METVPVLVAQTTSGVARVVGTRYDVLDVGDASLSDLVKSGAMEQLKRARVTCAIEQTATTVLAPVTSPGKMIIVGLNYKDHAAEIGAELPRVPRVFFTAASALIGPDEDIELPRIADTAVDFEGEVAVVIGAPASEVSVEKAWAYVAGLTIANDVTARDVQDGTNPGVAGANVGLAKGFDGFKPVGPALLIAENLCEKPELALRTRVDGEIFQESNTANMIFSIPELVSQVSQYTTLQPGDVILTGTPGGVGLATGRYLRAGQVVEVELQGVGVLRNRVVPARAKGPSD